MAPPQSSQPATSLVMAIASLGVAAAATTAWYLRRKDNKEYKIPAELLKSNYAAELKLAVELALTCGDNMTSHCQERGTVNAKDSALLGMEFKGSPQDFCTAVDLQNEEFVTRAIEKHFPHYAIIGEESTGTGALPELTTKPTFIIDPIDGTTNFASGLCLTCVSIGLAVYKRPIMGVVYAPMTRELYLSVRGHGAYRNGVLLDSTPTTTSLGHAVIDFEFGYEQSTEAIRKMVGAVERLLQHGCRATRSLGSGVLDILYVATGRLDVVYAGVANEGWKPWDYAAALVIAVEAGCSIESLIGNEGKELDIYDKSIVCAGNKELLQDCRRVILQGL